MSGLMITGRSRQQLALVITAYIFLPGLSPSLSLPNSFLKLM